MGVQDVIVWIIVAASVLYILRAGLGLGKSKSAGGNCGCGTTKCPIKSGNQPPNLVTIEGA